MTFLLLSVATGSLDCNAQYSCNDCAILGWCGWDTVLSKCTDTSAFYPSKTYISDQIACGCMKGSYSCADCSQMGSWCGYCGRDNQCTEDDGRNEAACGSAWHSAWDCAAVIEE